MHVVLVSDRALPDPGLSAAGRMVVWLGRALQQQGHRVTLLAPAGSAAPEVPLGVVDLRAPLDPQLPPDTDVVHLNGWPLPPPEGRPWLASLHSHAPLGQPLPPNSVFASAAHARAHGATAYVHYGLDPARQGSVVWSVPRHYLLFLGKASWRAKNLTGAKRIARLAQQPLAVLGGTGTDASGRVTYLGVLRGAKKHLWLNRGRALLYPVLWNEPFGLAMLEAMYFGCPVLGSPYGALPEIVTPEVGVLSARYSVLAEVAQALQGGAEAFDRRAVQAHVLRQFTTARMAQEYARLYERVMAGEALHTAAPQTVEDLGRYRMED